MRSVLITAVALLALTVAPSTGLAKSKSSKTAAVPPAASAPPGAKTTRCKDASGKFAKCPASTAAAAPAAAPAGAMAATTSGRPATATVASAAGSPAGASARCKDGSYSMSKTHSGACSHHGGVGAWLK